MSHREFERLLAELNGGAKWLAVDGVRVCGWSVVVAAIGLRLKRTLLVIAPTQQHADRLYEDVRVLWAGADEAVELHPRLYRFPSLGDSIIGRDPDEVSSRERLACLLAIAGRSDCVVIAPVEALIHPTASREAIRKCSIKLRRGSRMPMDALIDGLQSWRL